MDKLTITTKDVSIEFPGVKALSNVDFEVSTGEIRAVVGANGAGKSTLMKILAGVNPGYTGEVLLNGEPIDVRSPIAAKSTAFRSCFRRSTPRLSPHYPWLKT